MSENVKAWRKRTRWRIIEAMGGKCVCCGYAECYSAMAFHHINPDEKDFTISNMRSNPKSWTKIVEELRKCVLVCHNCHSEIHHGMGILPSDAIRFNEAYSSYSNLDKIKSKKLFPFSWSFLNGKECENCRKITTHKKYCTLKCAAAGKKKIWIKIPIRRPEGLGRYKKDWPSNEKLIESLKTLSYDQLAIKLEVSDNAIRKRLSRQRIKDAKK